MLPKIRRHACREFCLSGTLVSSSSSSPLPAPLCPKIPPKPQSSAGTPPIAAGGFKPLPFVLLLHLSIPPSFLFNLYLLSSSITGLPFTPLLFPLSSRRPSLLWPSTDLFFPPQLKLSSISWSYPTAHPPLLWSLNAFIKTRSYSSSVTLLQALPVVCPGLLHHLQVYFTNSALDLASGISPSTYPPPLTVFQLLTFIFQLQTDLNYITKISLFLCHA